MMATAPAPEFLNDHRGALKPRFEMPLLYEAARLGIAFHEAGHAVLAMDERAVLTGDGIAALTGMVNLSYEGGAA